MTPSTPAEAGDTEVYARLGVIVRDLHEALRVLGAGHVLTEAAAQFPSARERLLHIGQLTEKAAHTVLNKVEETAPMQERLADSALQLALRWDAIAPDAMPASLQELATQTRVFLASAGGDCAQTCKNLSAIMMAQDFQDLTGQLIKKVVDVIAQTENDLLRLLIDAAPATSAQHLRADELLAGPGAPGSVALEQDGVDDLLAELGF
ncbi:protein phosphatase CheZ [Noviherbaspirillum malthae]|uniref:protein phosphatase CheZ n=1 Tax=Noviherbaspirillum malthae TaxID=1260987 RepID=UPI00188F2961|nr:protein phosphatase CheZ [Noviherbaspirillum malthae]